MKAVRWHGKRDVRVDNVAEPRVVNPRDAVVEVTSTAICGSDLHLYNGLIPSLKKGDVLGHEFMGRVVEVGANVANLQVGDRVVVPFNISCGRCPYCTREEFALCDNSNPNAWMVEKLAGFSCGGMFGYSHMFGGYAGGQAQYVRVPYADVGPLKLPAELSDDRALFLSDIFPTGFMAAENCDIKAGDVVAVWGCGPVGQFAIQSAFMLGAERVIGIDRIPERLDLARKHSRAEVLNLQELDVVNTLKEMTGGRGPDACIDAVGMESHGTTIDAVYDQAAQKMKLETDRSHALREAITACGKGGTVSIPGVYSGILDKFPLGVAFTKGLKFRMGQTHCQKYMPRLLDAIMSDQIDPTFIITDHVPLDDAPDAYAAFTNKEDGCLKVVMRPQAA